MPDVEVEVVKPFNEHAHGGTVHPPERIIVSDTRADELKRSGLARDPVEEKAAPTPQNKAAPAAQTKAVRPGKTQ